jgi:tellurite resistance protein TerC
MDHISTTAWEWTIAGLIVVLGLDFLMALRNREKQTSMRAATLWTIFYVLLAIIFGWALGEWSIPQRRSEFFAGWMTEYSLSFDNLFVFILILARLKVAKEREELVLFIGIVSSLLLRGIFIAGGSAIVNRWSWIFFFFGGFLMYTAVQLFRESEHEEWQEGRLLRFIRARGASTFVVALVAIATTNVLFAFDSIPAIFGLTKSPYVIVTANVFALMGLRQLYFLIGGLMQKLVYLTEGLSIILAFIGIKLILEASDSQGWKVPQISLSLSLSFIVVVLVLTAIVSLLKAPKHTS